ncbi:cytochrome P450 [Streptomyces phaeochromogenes]|uniref:cytochrome P450 n=1 Tax=Streptomyces phaeochromogenes TaxID=1923 RepID=UPI00368326A8
MRLTHPTGDEAIDLEKVDLVDPVLHAEGDPHAIWLAMRIHDPVHWQQIRPDLGFWSATAFDHVARVLRDHTAFTSEHGTLLNLLGRKDPAGGKQLPATDPPRHTRMRSPIQRALNGRAVEGHRGVIRDEVRRLFGEIVDGEPFDFAALTDQLPMAVIGTLMGLDRDDWSHLTFLTTQAVAPDDPEFVRPEGAQATLHRAHRELFACLQDAVAKRRGGGTGDLIDVLSTMEFEDGGGPLTAGEIVSNCYSLLLGANVTTPHVPNAALAELTATGTYADWAEHPELLDSGIEEALRWSSPTSHFIRYATHDVQLGKVTVRAGEAVAAWIGSANRDMSVFPDPYTFDVRRNAQRHLAFGVGPHFCLGHALVRITLEEFFQELFAQFEHFEPAGEPVHLQSNFIAGIKHLPLIAARRKG